MISFKMSGNIGDILAALPAIRALGGGILYLNSKGLPIRYRPGSRHPLKNRTLSPVWTKKLIPLLEPQPYLKKVIEWKGEEVDYDLDSFRDVKCTGGFNLAAINLARACCLPFLIDPDLFHAWLTVKPDRRFKNCILVNRTIRYINPTLSYSFLRNRRDVVFLGLRDEYRVFSRQAGLVEFVEAPDYLTLARWVAGCKLFVGNQSFCYWVAEGLKVKRILEVCPYCPNVSPSNKGYEIVTQAGLERAITQLS